MATERKPNESPSERFERIWNRAVERHRRADERRAAREKGGGKT